MAGKIVINREHCLNTKYKNMECKRCQSCCPVQCIKEDLAIQDERCNHCGMCLAACPAEAIAGDGYSPETLQELVEARDPLVLSCARQDSKSSWPCLGFLDARLLLALCYSGENRPVAVDNAACGNCQKAVAHYLQETIAAVNKVLLLAGKNRVIQGQAASQLERKDKVLSRRNFFASLLEEALHTVREVKAEVEAPEPMPRQTLFTQYCPNEVDSADFLYNIVIGTDCRACGHCARICPHQAIVIKDHGSFLDFLHNPKACTGCGVCAANCPQTAMEVIAGHSVKEYHVAQRELPRCTVCNDLYQPTGKQLVCLECLLKGNR